MIVFLSEHGTILHRGADLLPSGHASYAGDDAPLLDASEADAASLAIEPAPLGALVRLRRRTDGMFLSAGNQGGAIAWSDEASGWETFLPITEGTLRAVNEIAGRPLLRHDTGDTVAPPGLAIAPDFALRLGTRTMSIRDGLSVERLGDRASPRLLVRRGPDRTPLILSRFDPTIIWHHDGTDDADEEIALGTASVRDAGLFSGPVIAPVGGMTAPLPHGAGPILVLSNGVVCTGPLHALFQAAVGHAAPLAALWRRLDADPCGPDGLALPLASSRIGGPDVDAIDPAILLFGGSENDLALLARLLAPACDREGDASRADRFRLLARASGTRVDTATIDRFVTLWRPDRARSASGTLTNARALPADWRITALREILRAAPG